jgi:hypothetical protein
MSFIRLNYTEVNSLIELIEELLKNGDDLSPEESKAFSKLKLIREAQKLAYAEKEKKTA